jgi:hypothetical protein
MSAADVPLLITSENSSSERRISPAWTIAQLKGRLEPVTGIPASSQRLSIRIGSQAVQPIEAADEESTQLSNWPLQAYAEIRVGLVFHVSFTLCLLSPSSVFRSFTRFARSFRAQYERIVRRSDLRDLRLHVWSIRRGFLSGRFQRSPKEVPRAVRRMPHHFTVP